jgi:hypothetical protein
VRDTGVGYDKEAIMRATATLAATCAAVAVVLAIG